MSYYKNKIKLKHTARSGVFLFVQYRKIFYTFFEDIEIWLRGCSKP